MIDADLGTTVVCMVTAGAVLYVAGVERRYFITAAVLATLVIPAAIVAKPYRMLRVISYVDPEYKLLDKVDPNGWVKSRAKTSVSTSDAGYQARQSKIAVATGGVLGVGLMESKQKLFYLPEAHNDFIYAVVAEELGFWGATAVVIGYVLILWRGFRLYFMAQDDFGKYLAIGVSVAIVAQALMNISVALAMAPTKGFPLPLISYGGSSLLSSLSALGILLSVSDHAG
jgi:cell division protein FtsW